MAERDELARSIALAKSALAAPQAARARVRARLASAGAMASGGSGAASSPNAALAPAAALVRQAAPSVRRSLAQGAKWVALGLCAGYWLGFHRTGASLWEPTASPPAISAPALDTAANRRDDAVAHAPAAASPAPESAPLASLPDVERATAAPAPARGSAREPAAKSTAARSARPLPRRAAPPRAAASRPPAPRPSGISSAEIALLERAERAIRAGEGELALVFLDQLDEQFPVSPLREERRAARVLARCTAARRAGSEDRAAARARAEQFLTQSSNVYAERVRELCELDAPEK